MSSFVRSSKFRNIIVTPFKRENTYENIQVSDGSAVSTGYGNCVDASTNFLAYIDKSSSGSCIGVLPHSSIGRRHVPVHAKTYKHRCLQLLHFIICFCSVFLCHYYYYNYYY